MFFNLFKHHNKTKTERLYHTYRNVMYVAAFEVLEDNTLAQDAIHESFERIMKNLHKIDENDTARTSSFLTIICRNVAINMKKQRLPLLYDADRELTDGSASAALDPLEIVINREQTERYSELLKNLSPKYRDVILLKHVHGYTRKEIAETLGIAEETVKKRLYRGQKELTEKAKEEDLL